MPNTSFSFVTEMKRNKRKVRKRPGSEAESPIFVIIRRTRYAQTASHVDLFVSLRDTRIEEDSENPTPSKDLLMRNVFENSFEENM